MADEEPTFERSLTRLEEIVEQLERGDLSLDESLSLFQEGIALSRLCTRKLDAAEKQVQQLIRMEDGKLILEPWSSADDGSLTDKER